MGKRRRKRGAVDLPGRLQMTLAGFALGAVAVGAGVVYILESPTSPLPYATTSETPHEAGPLKAILQGIPDVMWPNNKNPFGNETANGFYENKREWKQFPQGQFGVSSGQIVQNGAAN